MGRSARKDLGDDATPKHGRSKKKMAVVLLALAGIGVAVRKKLGGRAEPQSSSSTYPTPPSRSIQQSAKSAMSTASDRAGQAARTASAKARDLASTASAKANNSADKVADAAQSAADATSKAAHTAADATANGAQNAADKIDHASD